MIQKSEWGHGQGRKNLYVKPYQGCTFRYSLGPVDPEIQPTHSLEAQHR